MTEDGRDRARFEIDQHLRNKLAILPDQSGCYLMKDLDGNVIYVGKAKVLKNRVRSYFNGTHDGKTQRLVSEICDFEYIVTKNNLEALILECNLIKQYFPRYNVLLKDDKTFPYIKITNEKHPRLLVVRRVLNDKAKYFGPYPNGYAASQTKKLLDRLYPLRKCDVLPAKVCLYYHIGQCAAPCEFPVESSTYDKITQEITKFLSGGFGEVQQMLRVKMEQAAEQLQFERAREFRDQLQAIDALMEKQKITLNDAIDRDVFGYHVDKGWMCVAIMYMRQGKMIERRLSMFAYYGEAYDDFLTFVSQYYSDNPALPKEILLPEPREAIPDEEAVAELAETLQSWLGIKVHVPKRGRKHEVVAMASDNAKVSLEEKFRLAERDEERTLLATDQLAEALGMDSVRRMEAFDNSNIQGTNPVAAMVVFNEGKPDKKQYRKYNIRTVVGADDYESMREVIRRRYSRLLKEQQPLPDIILVDGGKGQISAALGVLEDELGLEEHRHFRLCGLVKDEKHKTAQLMTSDFNLITLARDSQAFYLLQRIQEEVHRFAISFHIQQRGKSMVASQLDRIPGIGEQRRKLLLSHFGSLKRMKEAGVEQFRQLGFGDKLAKQIMNALREEE